MDRQIALLYLDQPGGGGTMTISLWTCLLEIMGQPLSYLRLIIIIRAASSITEGLAVDLTTLPSDPTLDDNETSIQTFSNGTTMRAPRIPEITWHLVAGIIGPKSKRSTELDWFGHDRDGDRHDCRKCQQNNRDKSPHCMIEGQECDKAL